jgi:hypothetical protein
MRAAELGGGNDEIRMSKSEGISNDRSSKSDATESAS